VTKTTTAFSQQTEPLIEGQLHTIEADYQRLFEQKSDTLIQLVFAKLHRMLIDEVPPLEGGVPWIRRVQFQAERYDTGVEFNAEARCYDRDDNEAGALDELLRTDEYDEIESLIGELNTLHSPFSGSESLELHLVRGFYVLTA
jgi:hypothetical protein